MNITPYITTNRNFALTVLPDIAVVTRPSGGTVNNLGVYVPGSIVNGTHEGSIYLPCRFDPSRAFRPDQLREQEAVVNEYLAHFPLNTDVRPGDKITLLRPVSLISNATFLDGLTGWGGPTSGTTYQEVKLPGVSLTFGDATQLLQRSIGTGLDAEHLKIIIWVEVKDDGEVEFYNPVGNVTLTGSNAYTVVGVHGGSNDDVYLTADDYPTRAHVAKLDAYHLRTGHVFEVRKSNDISQDAVTSEFLVSELEFQHTDG